MVHPPLWLKVAWSYTTTESFLSPRGLLFGEPTFLPSSSLSDACWIIWWLCRTPSRSWVLKSCGEAAVTCIFPTFSLVIQNTDSLSPILNTSVTKLRNVNCLRLVCWPEALYDLSSEAKRLKGFHHSALWGTWAGAREGGAKFLLYMVDGSYEKKMGKGEWYFGFIMFLEKHTCTYIHHTFLHHVLIQGQILLYFLLFPTKRSRKSYSIRE